MPRGRLVDLHYLPAEITMSWNTQKHTAPRFTVSRQRYQEIVAEAPNQRITRNPFRILQERRRDVTLEWI